MLDRYSARILKTASRQEVRKPRFPEPQIVVVLKQAEAAVSEGFDAGCLGISPIRPAEPVRVLGTGTDTSRCQPL